MSCGPDDGRSAKRERDRSFEPFSSGRLSSDKSSAEGASWERPDDGSAGFHW